MVITARALRAQQKAMPVIGYLNAAKPLPNTLDEFRNGLAENGYHEGQNVLIEYRSAEGQYDRLPAMAAELVRRDSPLEGFEPSVPVKGAAVLISAMIRRARAVIINRLQRTDTHTR
jgi:hypothetical protein